MNKSTFQNVSVASISESKTNPRGTSFEGSEFNDLVASIKESGIIVPLILRSSPSGVGYEVVAGHRRLRAAQKLKLPEVPANIQELSDNEAREVQIIENLQRADVHPLEEGQAYRKLVEESHCEVASVAAKVGKSESYVRQRIFLTRLEEATAGAYRAGTITDGHAVLIAKLSENDQEAALKFVTSGWNGTKTIADLKEYIDTEFYKPLERQPWLKDTAVLTAVGPCKECPPNVPSLFGSVKEGACTDKKCWKRKMNRYIDYRKEKNPDLVLISEEYNYTDPDKESKKGIVSTNRYENVGPSNKCDHSVLGLVAVGRNIGSQIRICVAKECKVHMRSTSSRALTPEEKAKREKEAAAEKARAEKQKQKERQEMATALKKVKWPLTRKTLDVLFECQMEDSKDLDEICERRAIEVPKTNGYDDEQKGLRKATRAMSDAEMAELVVEIALMQIWNDDNRIKLLKQL